MSTSAAAPFGPLLASLFEAFEATGAATVPAGRSPAEIAALLTRAMRDPYFFMEYREALAVERKRRGLERRLLSAPSLDIPEQEILRDGFANLPGNVLADLALSPEALEALEHTFYGEGPNLRIGDWIDADPPEENSELPTSAPPTQTAVAPHGAAGGRIGRWVGLAAALAACLLLGVFIGTKLGGRSDRYEFALAAVETRGAGPRGIQDVELVVQNGGDARAFVTVVGIFPERKRAVVFYRTGDTFVAAAPKGTTPVKNLPPEFEGATKFVVVVTGVPAGEAIRMSLPAAVSAAEADTFAEDLGRSLEALSVRSERRVVPVPAGKN